MGKIIYGGGKVMNVYKILDNEFITPQYIIVNGDVERAITEYKKGDGSNKKILSVELICTNARIIGKGNK